MIFAAAFTLAFAAAPQTGEPVDLFREDVLGTSFHLRLECAEGADEDPAKVIEGSVLEEIERWRRAVDSYDETSELRTLSADVTQVSAELRAALVACKNWRIETGGAFDPAVGHLEKLWRKAEASGVKPTSSEIAQAVHAVRTERPRLTDEGIAATGVEL
ncbi:MAG: FAD:protein FMN transferase, partial [Planctomycetota bacterium]